MGFRSGHLHQSRQDHRAGEKPISRKEEMADRRRANHVSIAECTHRGTVQKGVCTKCGDTIEMKKVS